MFFSPSLNWCIVQTRQGCHPSLSILMYLVELKYLSPYLTQSPRFCGMCRMLPSSVDNVDNIDIIVLSTEPPRPPKITRASPCTDPRIVTTAVSIYYMQI